MRNLSSAARAPASGSLAGCADSAETASSCINNTQLNLIKVRSGLIRNPLYMSSWFTCRSKPAVLLALLIHAQAMTEREFKPLLKPRIQADSLNPGFKFEVQIQG